jgi:tRNA wybutosine-synthesizing protein 2
MPQLKTICETKGVEGELRVPQIKKLFGDDTITIHKEHGISYRLDVSKIMFSKGNLQERKRIVPHVKDNEKILDMFAGIGYFSLGIAKSHPACEIIACEKNSVAFSFLEENTKLNNLSNITAINKDCRYLKYENMFDRIIMGYLPGTEIFLQHALRMIKSGGIIHYHNIYNENEIWSKPDNEISEACRARKLTFHILEQRKVKSYAPHVYHVVVDFVVEN